jgi:large subunit ribosomal protein L32
MAVPRKRKSHTRRRQQRSHDALDTPGTSKCSNCGAPKRPHHVCGACGFYKGKAEVKVSND